MTYVEDCSQGLLINRPQNNWFITVQGGANILFGHHDVHADINDRIGPQANIFVGKWVTPVFGFRLGASWLMPKGLTDQNGFFRKMNSGLYHDTKYYDQKFQGIGPEFDLLLNLTNWWCGYKPDRVYNAVLHGGAGAYWTFARRFNDKNQLKWDHANNTILFANVGLQNNFRVSKHVDLFVDAMFELIDFSCADGRDFAAEYTASLNAGFTYKFGKTDWNCPVTAVCPTWKYTDAEGDELVARLAQADRKIKSLEQQLNDCLNKEDTRGKGRALNECEGLATIYYPINVYTLDKRDKLILNSVADVMNNNPNKNYTLTGWADNYTGTDEINVRLRERRVDGVKNYLLNRGVNASQIDATIDNSNLTDLGIQGAPLDRAVTITENR